MVYFYLAARQKQLESYFPAVKEERFHFYATNTNKTIDLFNYSSIFHLHNGKLKNCNKLKWFIFFQ